MSDARRTEAEKRKQDDEDKNGDVSRMQKKAKENDAATEEEVEEFFAILRRIHVAMGHLKRGQGIDGRKLTEAEDSRLRSAPETEIGNGVKDGGSDRREDITEENMGLDLNSEPGPDF